MPVLFTLETDRLRLTWRGPSPISGTSGGRLVVEALHGTVRVTMPERPVWASARCEVAAFALEEETTYTVEVRSLTSAPVRLHHRDPLVTARLSALEDGHLLYGPVATGAQAGGSRFVVAVGGRPEVVFTITVAPAKVSEAELRAMQGEVEDALSGLALAYLRGTTQAFRPEVERSPARPVWLALLREALPPLDVALRQIAARPREDVVRTEANVRSEAVRRPDAATLRALRRGAGTGAFIHRLPQGVPVRAYLPAAPARRTLDTPAHRWLRARLAHVVQRIQVIRQEEAARAASERRSAVLAELTTMEERLRRLLTLSPLVEATPDAALDAVPLVMRTVRGYAEAYTAIQQLSLGLALEDGETLASPRDLAGLYEIWCYLTLATTVSELMGCPLAPASFFSATATGVALRLHRGRRHALRFTRMPSSGSSRVVRLTYEPRFQGPPSLLAQRPDFLLAVERPGHLARLFVLDAKYRRDDAAAYRRRHGIPGPPEEALGDLHRYRDAIVVAGASGVERPVEEAVALYPYREPEPGLFARSHLWTRIEAIGVGAIPLVPGARDALRRWLERVLRA